MPRYSTAKRRTLAVLAAALMVVSVAALLLGAVVTLISFSPGTDMADAGVFVRTGPEYVLAGLAGLALARWLRRSISSL